MGGMLLIMSHVIHGTIRGRMIELDADPGIGDGESVEVEIRRASNGRDTPEEISEAIRTATDRGWPPGFFENVIGGWKGELVRPPQGEFETRVADWESL